MNNPKYVVMLYLAACIILIIILSGIWLKYREAKHENISEHALSTNLQKDRLAFSINSLRTFFYEPVPNTIESISVKWLDYVPTYTINSDTLNERYDYSVDKAENVYRIITIGDSFTFGEYVNTSDNYSELLEDLLNSRQCKQGTRFEVINLGMTGYDISYTVERYRMRGQKYSPDLVIWLVNRHNFYQIKDRILERELQIKKSMSQAARLRYEQQGRYYIASERAQIEFIRRYGKEKILAMQKDILTEFSSLYNGPMIITLFMASMDATMEKMIREYAVTRKSMTYIFDALPPLNEVDGILPDFHPSVNGHRIIAGNLFAYLYANGLYPCR